jgi:hypothetical protein
MTDFDLANDARCVRPAELDRLLNDIRRVRTAVEACHQWRPWLGDWRERLADAATSVDDDLGDIVPEADDEAERLSGMREVQQLAFSLCTALKATFGFGGVDSAGDDFPIYPSRGERAEDDTTSTCPTRAAPPSLRTWHRAIGCRPPGPARGHPRLAVAQTVVSWVPGVS